MGTMEADPLAPGMNRFERSATAELVADLYSAVNTGDLAALDTLADKWLTLSALDELSVDAWEQVVLANPLARAVRRGHLDVVLFLVHEKELRLAPPCLPDCSCRLCRTLTHDLRFRQLFSSRVLLALTSWAYVRLAFVDDPIGRCLDVWQRIQRSPLYSGHAAEPLRLQLRDRLEAAIVTCLDHAINEEEVVLLLTDVRDQFESPPLPIPLTDLTRLIRAEMRRAVAHPAIQALLMQCWSRDSQALFGPTVTKSRMPKPLWSVHNLLVYLLLVPVSCFFPHPRLIRFLKCPATVYTNEAFAYWAFLFIVTSSFFYKDESTHYIICKGTPRLHHYLLAVIILSRVFRTCDGLWHFRREFFTSPYELVQCVSSFMYATGMTLLVVSTHLVPYNPAVMDVCAKLALKLAPTPNITRQHAVDLLLRRPVSQCDAAKAFYDLGPEYVSFVNSAIEPHNLSAFFFAVGHLFYYLSAGQVLYMNRLVAHLNIAVTHMFMDVVRWALLMLLFYFAWALAMVSLYKNYSCENPNFSTMKSSLLEMFWVLFAMTGTTDYKMSSGVLKRMDHRSTAVIEYTGFVFYASYYIVAQIVLVNLLIALMSVTFQDIQGDRLTAMAYWRTKIQVKFIKWHRHSIMPTPFNILYPVYWVSSCVMQAWCRARLPPSPRRSFSFEEGKYTDVFRQMFDRKLMD